MSHDLGQGQISRSQYVLKKWPLQGHKCFTNIACLTLSNGNNLFDRIEIHSVFFRGEGSREEVPFRESFSKIGELRSLCPEAQMLALTATAGPAQRRKIIKSLCFKKNYTIMQTDKT